MLLWYDPFETILIVCLYPHCRLRSSEQREDWNPINMPNPATYLCLVLDFQRHMPYAIIFKVILETPYI